MAIPTMPLMDMSKIMEQFKLPGVDMAALVEARRKDIEALMQVNNIALEGFQTMEQKQAEILKATMEELQATTQKMAAKPMESATHEGQMVQQTLEKAFAYMRELADLTRNSQTEALAVINKRVEKNVEELKNLVQAKR
ncbi:MAG: TIGR01841 family phasin [Candidatus Methylophosphatis roskildensis]